MKKKRATEDEAENPTSGGEERDALANSGDPTGEGADQSDRPDAEEIQKTIREMLDDAKNFYESTLEPDQKSATDYYWGRPFGNEKANRSQAVSPVLRNATNAQIPPVMRILFGPRHVVEFRPRRLDAEPQAAQATDYVRYVITEDNPGFLTFLSVLKDGLIRRLGIMKWWWEDTHRSERTRFARLTQQDVTALAMDDAVDLIEIEKTWPDGTQDASVTHHRVEGRARFRAIPNEEFLFTPDARSLDEADLYAHSREVGIDELVAMGVADRETLEDFVEDEGERSTVDSGQLSAARQYHGGDSSASDDVTPESTRKILYTEAYARIKIDEDDDTVAERRLFKCLGSKWEIQNGDGLGEVADDDINFTTFTPDPEPHTLVGMSNWDKVKDLQLIESQILRGTLDSLSEAVVPMTEAVQGEVNIGDLIKPDASRIVRVRKPGMFQVHKHPFVGGDTLPMLEYFKGEREERVGAASIDADSLQSSTKAAVGATVTASQQQVEMLVRVFAETAMKDLCRGLLKLLVRHQDKPRVARLRGTYVEVDPRSWDATMDVQVNVGLGQGTPEDQLNTLAGIVSAQQSLMQSGAPFVSNVELRSALATGAELAGYPLADKFFKPWGEQEEQQMQQQRAQQPPPPDPATIVAQAEMMKAQAEVEAKKAEVEAKKAETERKQIEMLMDDDRERDRMAQDATLREYEIEAKYGASIADAHLKARVKTNRDDQELGGANGGV